MIKKFKITFGFPPNNVGLDHNEWILEAETKELAEKDFRETVKCTYWLIDIVEVIE